MRALVFIILIFTGCTGYQYVAPLHFVPVNYEKGHGVGNLASSSCQLGYAFTNHLSTFVITNFRENQNHHNIFYSKDEEGFYKTDKHHGIDFGISYFWNYDDFGSFEILSGIGYGTVQYRNFNETADIYDFSFDARKIKFSLQQSISIRYEDYIDFSLFARLNYTRYSNIKSTLDLSPAMHLTDYDAFFHSRNTSAFYFLEPGGQIRIGPKYVKLLIQGSGLIMLDSYDIFYRKYNLSIGISCSFNLIND